MKAVKSNPTLEYLNNYPSMCILLGAMWVCCVMAGVTAQLGLCWQMQK